jgi:hypothetical protein
MVKVKHSKYKNTGMLFEFLTKQITDDVINNDKMSALKIMETSFGKGSILSEELALYRHLMDNSFSNREDAIELIEKVVRERKKLDQQKLSEEKYNIVKKIKKNYDLDSIFKRDIKLYKEYASIYNLFEYSNNNNIPEYIKNKNTLVEHITKSNKVDNSIDEELSGIDFETKIQAYDIMVEKFNKKYNNLLPEQQHILTDYLAYCDNKVKMKEAIKPHIKKLVTELKTTSANTLNDAIEVKIIETTKLLEGINDLNVVYDRHITSVMKSYDLLNKLKKINND